MRQPFRAELRRACRAEPRDCTLQGQAVFKDNVDVMRLAKASSQLELCNAQTNYEDPRYSLALACSQFCCLGCGREDARV